ncbi:YdcF family protein [Rhizobium sp. PAMB 3174]
MNEIWKEILSYVAPATAKVTCRYCLVFGTRHGVDEFVEVIHRCFSEGAFEKIIISGGATMGNPVTEAKIIESALLNRGLPPDALILEPNSNNTYDNVVMSRSVLFQLESNIDSIAIVGKISSMRRYMMTIRKNWPEINRVVAYPVNIFSSQPEKWFDDTEFRGRVLGELDRIAKYQLKGDIEEIDISNFSY